MLGVQKERMFLRDHVETHRRDYWGLGRDDTLGILHIPLCPSVESQGDWYVASKKGSREVATTGKAAWCMQGGRPQMVDQDLNTLHCQDRLWRT